MDKIKLLESQIISYKVLMQNCNSPFDLNWYKVQIEGLKRKIEDLKEK